MRNGAPPSLLPQAHRINATFCRLPERVWAPPVRCATTRTLRHRRAARSQTRLLAIAPARRRPRRRTRRGAQAAPEPRRRPTPAPPPWPLQTGPTPPYPQSACGGPRMTLMCSVSHAPPRRSISNSAEQRQRRPYLERLGARGCKPPCEPPREPATRKRFRQRKKCAVQGTPSLWAESKHSEPGRNSCCGLWGSWNPRSSWGSWESRAVGCGLWGPISRLP